MADTMAHVRAERAAEDGGCSGSCCCAAPTRLQSHDPPFAGVTPASPVSPAMLCDGCDCVLATTPVHEEIGPGPVQACADCDCGLAERLASMSLPSSPEPQQQSQQSGTDPETTDNADALDGPVTAAAAASGPVCDACPQCDDTCALQGCEACDAKREAWASKKQGCNKLFTMCQVRRHNTYHSAWLVAKSRVYDVTQFVALGLHPAGARCILAKAGTDVTRDFEFHSSSAHKLWKAICIGRLVRCPSEACPRKFFSW